MVKLKPNSPVYSVRKNRNPGLTFGLGRGMIRVSKESAHAEK